LSLIHPAFVGVLRSIGTIATDAIMKAYHGDSRFGKPVGM
jgi:hypothetical protein